MLLYELLVSVDNTANVSSADFTEREVQILLQAIDAIDRTSLWSIDADELDEVDQWLSELRRKVMT